MVAARQRTILRPLFGATMRHQTTKKGFTMYKVMKDTTTLFRGTETECIRHLKESCGNVRLHDLVAAGYRIVPA